MGGTQQLEAFLFYELKIVGLALGDRIKLFDLLVKKKGAWGTRIINLGSFLLYRRKPSDPDSEFQDPDGDFASYREQIEQGLKLLEEDPCRHDLRQEGSVFTAHTDFVERKERISKASGLAAKILHYFTGQFSTSRDLECTIVNPSYHGVTDEALHALFVGDAQEWPLWKPDLEEIKRCSNPKVEHDGNLEIWIVTEKDYCDEFHFRGAQHTSADASAVVDGHTAVHVGAHAGRSAAASRQTLGRHQLGFKAIRLFYDSQGDLKQWRRNDMGDTLPSLRDDEEDQSFRDPFFHMGGLFAQSPPVGEVALSGLSLQCLDIESVQLD